MQDIQVMVTLFAIVVLGYVLRRFGLMGGDFDKRLSSLIIDVCCPLLILSSVMGDKITVPGSLLVIGSSLAGISMRKMLTHGKVYVTTALRLFVVPLCIYLIFKACNVNELVNDINTTVIAMPVAAFGTMFCMKYERDSRLMTEITFMTTVLSICSIPLVEIAIKMI